MSNLVEQLNSEMSALVAWVHRSLVQVSNGRRGGAGAGTIWHADGLIITNAHVVHHRAPKVTLADGRALPARILAVDPQRDLAALAVEAHNLPTVALGRSEELQPGQWVVAVGHPWGVAGAVTAGTVIAVGRPPEMVRYQGDLIQVGLHLRPGHSGGPLVDADGRIVGINTMIAGPDVGLAIPLHVVKRFLRENVGGSV